MALDYTLMDNVFKVILFDGVCNLCNSSVNFIIDRDTKNEFRFAALQSEVGQRLLSSMPAASLKDFDSVVLIEGDRIYKKSTAALRIARSLKGIWSWLYIFILIPRFLRDPIYNLIANNRYRWFGKKDSCRIPTAELRSRFLE
jgi:predicted DCC family thiol-disulfide oxidoreductase YuxK